VSTDGSCLKNPGGPSGWAWYAGDNCWESGGFNPGTNQQAELLAVLAALKNIPLDIPIVIRMDSQYALKSCTQWMAGWKKKGWKKADGQPVMNLEIMQALDAAMAARTAPFKMEWVRGHRGDMYNENADYLCGQAARASARNQSANPGPGWGAGPDGQVSRLDPRPPQSRR
jgi:ribonuclease HI